MNVDESHLGGLPSQELTRALAAQPYLIEFVHEGCMDANAAKDGRHDVQQCRLCSIEKDHDRNCGGQAQHISSKGTAAHGHQYADTCHEGKFSD